MSTLRVYDGDSYGGGHQEQPVARSWAAVVRNTDKKPVCVLFGLREGGGARVAQKLWESIDRRLSSVVAAENSLWIVEFPAGKVHDSVANTISTQLENGFDELGLEIFHLPSGGLEEINNPDFDQDMAPDGHVTLIDGPLEYARLFVEVGDSQKLGSYDDTTTLLETTQEWLRSEIADYICVLVVKLYRKVENDGSFADGMLMSLINNEAVQWICSWGDTSEDDTASVFNTFCTDKWGLDAPATPPVQSEGMVFISLANHFPVLDQGSMQRFLQLLKQKLEGGVLAGAPPEYAGTMQTLTEQVQLLENKDNTAVFTDGATIAINGDRIYRIYLKGLRLERLEKREAKRQRRNL